MSRLHGRARLVVIVLALLGAASCGAPGDDEADPPPEPAPSGREVDLDEQGSQWRPSDEYERLTSQLQPDGRLDRDDALSLFALQYGELPGAPVPAGDGGAARSGNAATSAVFGVWDELTDAQRLVVMERLELGSAPGVGASEIAPGRRGRSIVRRADVDVAAYQRAADAAVAVLERRLGPLGTPVVVTTSNQVLRSAEGTPVLADTMLLAGERCRIRVFPAHLPPPAGADQTLAHEVFHCYQQMWTPAPWRGLPLWSQEGAAEWVGSMVVAEVGGTPDPDLVGYLRQWYGTPDRPLFQRSYDAYGWFATVAHAVGPLWGRLREVTTVDNVAAYRAAAAGGPDADTVSQWASRQSFRPFGERWRVVGEGVPAVDQRQIALAYPAMRNGDLVSVVAPAYATGWGDAALEADLTRFNALPPTVGSVMIGSTEHALASLTSTTWCTDPEGRCTCPPGTARAGQSFPRLPGAEMFAAVGAGEAEASLTVQGTSLEDECGQELACPVGKWVMTSPPAGLPFEFSSGGTGTILTVDPDGTVLLDYADFAPAEASVPSAPGTRLRLTLGGLVRARVDLPTGTEPFGARSLQGWDTSGLTGSGVSTMQGVGQVTMSEAELRMLLFDTAGAGEILIECDTSAVTISGGGVVHTYEPA